MTQYSDPLLGITLNTSTRYLEPTPSERLRQAHNDPAWLRHDENAKTSVSKAPAERCVRSLPAANERTLPRLKSKFKSAPSPLVLSAVSRLVGKHIKKNHRFSQGRQVLIVQLDCGLHTLKRYLSNIQDPRTHYIGVDKEPRNYPDVIANLEDSSGRAAIANLQPDLVVALNNWHTNNANTIQVRSNLAKLAEITPKQSMVVICVPQRVGRRSPARLSKDHLSAVKATELSCKDWVSLVEDYFVVKETKGLGFFSRQPHYLPADSSGNRAKRILTTGVFHKTLSQLDGLLCRCFGDSRMLQRLSNQLIIAAFPKA